jgi:hypothetical protein
LPLFPQVETACATQFGRGSLTPAGTGTQRPRELLKAQYEQVPVQAALQQTPSTQKLDLHCPLSVQICPRPRRPQLPPAQTLGATHSSLETQVSLQLPPTQRDGAQLIGEPATQVPFPSQLDAGTRLPPEQDAALHMVPAACLAQPPSPLQLPSCPQVSAASGLQTPCGSALAAGTGMHSPLMPS